MPETYSRPTSGELDPESPLTTGLMNKLDANPHAIAENNASAPDVVGASWVKIEEQTASASASLTFTTGIDSTYTAYVFVITGLRAATAAAEFMMEVSINAGSSWVTSADYGYYLQERGMSTGAAGNVDASSILLAQNLNDSSNSREGAASEIWLYDPSNTAVCTLIKGETIVNNYVGPTSHAPWLDECIGCYTETTAVNGVKFYMSSGNIEAGVFKLFGIRCV